ncbi:MAG: choline-sulfatase [Rhodospirillales bacterium]|nr:choline-sulfatase [Rhodospirillales bacterium]MDH3791767.1 choline-sulfatase [Rhodospirillales bacterium]MDH3917259.1 choline-sulfatase [Rhodospirillales bacterium]MDH3967229.1 choline-sulfatase [Rhodospirillales bacterium]
MPDKTPNILFVMADQMAAPALPVYGHPVVKAPRLAGLAESGVVFDAAYCNSPICAPSRFSMLSGQLPSAIGAYDNAAEFPASVPTFAHHLRLAGYRTVLAGKMHFVGPDQLHGFEERLTTDIYPADFGWTPDWEHPERHQDYFHTMLSVVEAGPCARSQQIDFDDDVAFQAERRIYDLARDDDDRPFFLLASFTHPHDPYTIGRPYWERYDAAEIDMPRVPAIPLEEQDPHSRRIARCIGLKRYDVTEARIRNARRAYYGAISYVDNKLGGLLDALAATGLAEDTIVIFAADHGDMLGERGLWYKMTFFEGAARVPLIVHAPDRFAPRRVARCVSLLDLFPTLCDLAAGAAPAPAEPLEGRSLMPLLDGREAGWVDRVFGEYLGEGAAGPLVMVREGRFKYVVGEASPPQLFDLEADPLELDNLAGRAAHAEAERAFEAQVAARWDLAALRRAVLLSQRRRRLAFRAISEGRHTPWDFQPAREAAKQYARNLGVVLGDIERKARLPHSDGPPPDGKTG